MYVKNVQGDELQDAYGCVCVDQMRKRHFTGLEVSLMVLFALVLVVAVAMIVLVATGEPGTIKGR